MSSNQPQTKHGATSWLLWATYALLVAVGIPWYWPSDSVTLWLGVPAWAVTALVCSLGVSLLTALAFQRRWPGEENGR